MADFKVQRGFVDIPATSTSTTITAGTDYTAPAASTAAFARIVSTGLSGLGPTSGGGDAEFDDFTCHISNPENITTSLTFTRDGSTGDTRAYYEIIEYTGSAGGTNEMIVRDHGVAILPTASNTTDTAAISVTDDNDVVVFITGQSGDAVAGSRYPNSCSSWVFASNVARFEDSQNENNMDISYAVVEFTGSNWNVQWVDYKPTSNDVWEVKELPTTLSDVDKTFSHVQVRQNQGIPAAQRVGSYISSTTQIAFRINGLASSSTVHAWIVENTQSGGQTDMAVSHYTNLTRSGNKTEPDTWTNTVTDVGVLAEASIMGECTYTDSAAADDYTVPCFATWHNATNQVTHWRSETGAAIEDIWYQFQSLRWPTETAVSASTQTGEWRNVRSINQAVARASYW